MIISQSGIVDIIPEYNRQLRPIFCVSEGDKNTRMINITVQQAGENFSIPSGASVYVTGKKQDNTIFTYQCTKSGYIVSFQIAEQMSAANGIVLCELQIIENGNPLGSANFVYWVEPSPVQNGTASESDLNVFLEAILGAEKLDHFWANVEEAVTEAVEAIQIHEGQTVIDASLSVSGAAADAKATGDIVRGLLDALITETTSSSIVAIADDAAGILPLKELTCTITLVQDGSGDPSPDNYRLIRGATVETIKRYGKNLLNPAELRKTNVFIINGDGSYTFVKYGPWSSGRITDLSPVPIKAGVPITFSADVSNVTMTDGDSIGFSLISSPGTVTVGTKECIIENGRITATIVPTADGNRVRFYYKNTSTGIGVDTVTFRNMQIEYGDTPTAYEEPIRDTYTIAFPAEQSTVYGGTLTVYEDGSGVLVVDKGYFKPDATSTVETMNKSDNGNRCGILIPDATANSTADIVCSCGVGDTAVNGGTTTNWVVGHCALYRGSGGTYFRYIFPTTVETAADALQYLVGLNCDVVYNLPSPLTYALSAQAVVQMLKGANAIWADDYAVTWCAAEYYADTALYVDKTVNAQKKMIAGVEAEMVATINYAVGDLLIVGNTLYKVTAAVSSGAALVVGTNVTETTVAEQLLALA